MQTSRERVVRCLTFGTPDRVPRQLWSLPWVETRFPREMAELRRRFPSDIGGPGNVYRPSPRVRGGMFDEGVHVDAWGCVFENLQAGVHGEVRHPALPDLADWRSVRPPEEILPGNPAAAREAVKRDCAASDLFMSGGCCPRPWERYQFLRGSENALIDVIDGSAEFRSLLKVIHDFNLRELEFWASTDVDALNFMDDWGAQRQLLIPPALWREWFKPLYRDYCDIARANGKFIFMHSDGCIAEIYPDLVEIGVNAINSQLFCMDMADLAAKAKGRITFWGEIDRQHVLPSPDPEAGREAVRTVARHFYDPRGGVIAQFELGPGSNPAVGAAVFEEWERIGTRVGPASRSAGGDAASGGGCRP